MPGGRALQVEDGDGLAVRSPLGGRPVQDENDLSQEPSAGFWSFSPYQLPPLQRLSEALIEPLLYEAKEGSGGRWVVGGLAP